MKIHTKATIFLGVLATGFGLALLVNDAIKQDTPLITQSNQNQSSGVHHSVYSTNNSSSKLSSNTDIQAPPTSALIDPESKPILEQMFPQDDPAWIWAQVDLDELKQAMPDNLYWQFAVPTKDESILEFRKEQKDYWKKQYARVLSNQADEDEIRDYYAHQEAISSDYVVFITALLNKYSSILPEEAYKLQTLARNMHLSRLEEIPLRLTQSLNSQKAFTKNRNNWLADKEAYEASLSAEREAALKELGKI